MPFTTVSLTTTTRPLRVIFIIREREDISRAVKLFTHTWGGMINVMLPSPTNDLEAEAFDRALRRCDPDLVLTSGFGKISPYEVKILERFPTQVHLVDDEAINNHIQGERLIRITNGILSHPAFILEEEYRSPLSISSIRLLNVESDSSHLHLHYGNPSKIYSQYLTQHLAGQTFRQPKNLSEELKLCSLAAYVQTSLSLTVKKVNRQATWPALDFEGDYTSLETIRSHNRQTLFLFLDDGSDLHIPSTFWNTRGRGYAPNKIILPQQRFMAEIDSFVNFAREGVDLKQLILITKMEEDEARRVYLAISESMRLSNQRICVAVYYENIHYVMPLLKTHCDIPETSTRATASDSSIRFNLRSPLRYNQQDVLFGYDAEVLLEKGKHLSLPSLPSVADLLTNEPERLQRARDNEGNLRRHWLRSNLSARPYPKGVSGWIRPGAECLFFLHSNEVWIREVLLGAGLRIVPNRHTRYAHGFVRKFGDLEKTVSLVRDQGHHIINALRSHRAAQSGFKIGQIEQFLIKQFDLERTKAHKIVEARLPELLAAGLIRRGIELQCPMCDLKQWYPIEDINEFMECGGCAEKSQLQTHRLEYHYRANELAVRFFDTGGEALLMTTSVLLQIDSSASILFGGDLFRDNESQSFAEIDLILLSQDALLVVECKTYTTIEEEAIREIKQSAAQAVKVAQAIDADGVILGIVARQNGIAVRELVHSLANDAFVEETDIDLILNGQMYLRGEEAAADSTQIVLKSSRRLNNYRSGYIGKLQDTVNFGIGKGPFSITQSKVWIQELMDENEVSNFKEDS